MICTSVLMNETNVIVTVAGAGGEEERILSPNRWKRLVGQMNWESTPLPPFAVTPEFYDALVRESKITTAIRCAARIQSHAPQSKRTLIRKLREKGIEAEPAEEAAAFLIRKGYLNEEEQAYAFAENAMTRKHYGKRRIRAALMSHGYTAETIRAAFDRLPEEMAEEALLVTIQKKYTPFPTDAKERQKAYAALMRLGYTGAEIQSMISKAKETGDE